MYIAHYHLRERFDNVVVALLAQRRARFPSLSCASSSLAAALEFFRKISYTYALSTCPMIVLRGHLLGPVR